MNTIKVLVVDDHVLVREGARAILENQPDIEVVGEASNGQEAVNKAESTHPDVILMDITMPGMNGMEATEEIKKRFPEIKILALTMHESDEYFFRILTAGASGYFIKGGSSAEMITALRNVAEGGVFLYPSMAKKLVSDYLHYIKTGSEKDVYGNLTRREREILKLVADGRSASEIAKGLFISATTVQTHRANIMSKLGLHSRTDLIKYALRHGFGSLDS